MKNIFKILKLFFTNNPINKFNIEYQLMLYYSKKNSKEESIIFTTAK